MHSDLLMLYCILECNPLHMGHFFTDILAHQGKFVHLGAIFTRPYITQMIRGMGLIEHTQVMKIVGTIALLGMLTLVSIRIVEKRGNTYLLTQHHGMSTHDPRPSHEIESESRS